MVGFLIAMVSMVSLTSLHVVVHVNMTEINSASKYITKPRLMMLNNDAGGSKLNSKRHGKKS